MQFAIAPSAQALDCKWVETSGEATVENITPEEARQAALSKARMKAVEGVSGKHSPPNQYEQSSKLKANEAYHFPSQGISLEMGTLPGHKRDTEAFYIIATKEKLNLSCPVKKNGEVTPSEFYKECFSLPADTRAEELLVYEVREQP